MATAKKTKKGPKGHPRRKGKGPARKPAQRPHKPANRQARRAAPARAVPENPQAHALARRIAHIAAEMKAQDVLVLDVRGKASYADYVVIASADNERLVAAVADAVDEKLRPEGTRPMSTEGTEGGNWVLLDYGDVVAHLFQQDARSFYDLEGLWADAGKERVS